MRGKLFQLLNNLEMKAIVIALWGQAKILRWYQSNVSRRILNHQAPTSRSEVHSAPGLQQRIYDAGDMANRAASLNAEPEVRVKVKNLGAGNLVDRDSFCRQQAAYLMSCSHHGCSRHH